MKNFIENAPSKKGRENIEKAPEKLSAKLESIMQGAKLVGLEESADNGREIFCLQVTDFKKWQSRENVENLLPYFGQAALQVYNERENTPEFDLSDQKNKEEAIENFTENELGINSTTYIIAENGRLIGFLTGTATEIEGKQIFNLGLSFISPKKRNSGIGKELYKNVFKRENYEAVLGCSSTPAAVKHRINAGKEAGYTGFFVGYKNGIFGDKGTPEQQALIEKYSRYIQEEYEQTSIPLSESPANYVVIRKEIYPIPPLEEKNLHFLDKDSLAPVFYNDVLPIQAKYLPHTVYGILINLRDEAIPEKTENG